MGGDSPATTTPEDVDLTGNEVANLMMQLPNHSCETPFFL